MEILIYKLNYIIYVDLNNINNKIIGWKINMIKVKPRKIIISYLVIMLIFTSIGSVIGVGESDDNSDWSITAFTANPTTAKINQRINFYVEISEDDGTNNIESTSDENGFDLVSLGTNPGEAHEYKYSYRIECGDGTNVLGYTDNTEIEAYHYYRSVGDYVVKVVIKNQETEESKERYLNKLINIEAEESNNKPPVAIIDSLNVGFVGDTIIFDGPDSFDTDGRVVSYKWNFGDGTSGKGAKVNHVYDEIDYYDVSLLVVDDKGLSGRKSVRVQIKEKEQTPNVDWEITAFTANPTAAIVNQRINFYVEISEDDGTNNIESTSDENGFDLVSLGTNPGEAHEYKYSYRIECGDGTNVLGYTDNTEIEAYHYYRSVGDYVVKVVIKNQETEESKERYLDDSIKVEYLNNEPTAIIRIETPSDLRFVGNTITFDGSNSFDTDTDGGDDEIVSYKWNFGDGTSGEGVKVEHVYDEIGYYDVSLRVVDNEGFDGENSVKIQIKEKKQTSNNGGDDPSQVDTSGGYVEIYDGSKYAQSFIPVKGKLDGVEIYVGKKGGLFDDSPDTDSDNDDDSSDDDSNNDEGSSDADPNDDIEASSSPMVSLLSKIESKINTLEKGIIKEIIIKIINKIYERVSSKLNQRYASNNNGGFEPILYGMGDLSVSIKDGLDGRTLGSKRISPEDVSRGAGWRYVDFSSFNIYLEVGEGKEYYIVLTHSDGNSRNYYKWFYSNGDLYSDGAAYSKESSGWQNLGYDFAFITHGTYTGDEPDGIVDKYAVVVGVNSKPDGSNIYAIESARAIQKVLADSGNGWTVTVPGGSESAIKNALINLGNKGDKDDIVLFYFYGHGGESGDSDGDGIPDEAAIFASDDPITARELNEIFDNYVSDKQVIIIESCNSGGFIFDNTNIRGDNRLIITSSKSGQSSWGNSHYRGYFNHYLEKGLKGEADLIENGGDGDGSVTAEEVYRYAAPRTDTLAFNNERKHQNPQMDDPNPDEDIVLT